MLKKICILFLGLVVFTGSACVTPTHASSAQNIIITRVQASGSLGAKEELIVLYNPSSQSIDITNWCLKNKNNVAFACFLSSGEAPLLYSVPSYGYITIASKEYVASHSYSEAFYTLVYTVTNQSSGSIVAGADSLNLIDTAHVVVDTLSWTDTSASLPALARLLLFSNPDTYSITGTPSDWRREVNVASPPIGIIALEGTPLPGEVDNEPTPGDEENEDEQENEDNGTTTPGAGLNLPPGSDEKLFVWPYVTELLPNPSGADAGREFIEIFNPNPYALHFEKFAFQIGITKPKEYALLNETELELSANGYTTLYNTGLMNFTLSNTVGKVQLVYNGVAVGNAVEYENAKDDKAWALIDDVWLYTDIVTPGQPNPLQEEAQHAAAATSTTAATTATTTAKPCASNQYRNPETGRCKLISAATAASSPVPCKEGQERNPETNRCRTIKAAAAPTPCKEGYERNLETGRCRKAKSMTAADYGVAEVQGVRDNKVQWYYWLGIIGVVSAILAYGVWEWRVEIKSAINKISRGILNRQN